MALDDLVTDDRERRPGRRGGDERERDPERGGGYGPARTGMDRDGPYSGRDGKSRGKGKGRRRLPPEEKALLNTRVFFGEGGAFVVKLHDTEVFVMKTGVAAAGGAKLDEPQTRAGPGEVAQDQAAKEAPAAAGEKSEGDPAQGEPPKAAEDVPAKDGEARAEKDAGSPAAETPASQDPAGGGAAGPAADAGAAKADAPKGDEPKADEPKSDEPKGDEPKAGESETDKSKAEDLKDGASEPKAGGEAKAPPDGVLVRLTSGTFRTAETRYILNEALHPLSCRVVQGGEATAWTVVGDGVERKFEDGMELALPKPATEPEAMLKRWEVKIEDARGRDEGRDAPPPRRGRAGDDAPGHGPAGPGAPQAPPRPYGVEWPPPGHMPPPGWPGYHPVYAGRPPPGWRGYPPPWELGHHHRPPPMGPYGAVPGRITGPRTPLPDSYFQ